MKSLLPTLTTLLLSAAVGAAQQPYYLYPDGSTAAGAPTYTLDAGKLVASATPAEKSPGGKTDTTAPCPCADKCDCPDGKCPSGCPVVAADPRDTQVKVTNYVGGLPASSGSGTVVACEGGRSLILTNKHVADNPGEKWVLAADGFEYGCRVVYHSPAYDLSVLETNHELPAAAIADGVPAVGSDLRQWGFTGGGPKVARTGPLLGTGAFTYEYGGYMPVLTVGYAPASGDSGAGVFDGNGRLVAVVTSTDGRTGSAVALTCVETTLTTVTTTTVTVGVRGPLFPRLAARLAARRAARDAALGIQVVPVTPVPNAAPKVGPAAPKDCPDGKCPLPGKPAPKAAPAPPPVYVLPPQAPPQVFVLPSSGAGGCAGGSCQPAYGYRFFRR